MTDKAKILVIDDEPGVLTLMGRALSQAGCDVVLADTGEKGMEVAHENRFDLAVLDVNLPDTTGFDIASDLKQRHISLQTQIVFITGEPREEDRQRSKKLGAADYIAKPFDMQNFAKRILSHAKSPKIHTQ